MYYEYPVLLYKTSNKVNKKEAARQESFSSGETVTIPLRCGKVYDAVDGKHYELLDWVEQPGQAEPLDLIVTEDKWGLRNVTFTMPERDVTLKAITAERYVVTYANLYGEDNVIEGVPGDPLPSYLLDGEIPKKENHAFVAWSEDGRIVELPETLERDHVFTAVWKPWDIITQEKDMVKVSASGKESAVWTPEQNDGIAIHIEVDISTFAPDHVYVNGSRLRYPQDFVYREGSTLIELTPQYMKTLSDGKVEVQVGFVTGKQDGPEEIQKVAAEFVVNTGEANTLPRTGDSSSLALWLGMLSASAYLGLLCRRKMA